MLASGHEDMWVEEFEKYVKQTLAYEGYDHDNYLLVRAVEIMKEQEKTIEELKNDKNRNNSQE